MLLIILIYKLLSMGCVNIRNVQYLTNTETSHKFNYTFNKFVILERKVNYYENINLQLKCLM